MLLVLGHNLKAGFLTLPQPPVAADITTKLFSELLSNSHTVAQPQACISPGSLCCCASPGQLLFQLCGLYSLSLFPWTEKHNCNMVQHNHSSGNGCCHPGFSLHHLNGNSRPRAPWQILSQEPPPSAPCDSAWCICLH